MSPHPASYKLEGHAAGDRDPEVLAHMAECEPCSRYVERAMALASADDNPFPLPEGMSGPAAKAGVSPMRGRLIRVTFGLVPFAAAAAIALSLHHSPAVPVDTKGAGTYETQFKGGIQLAVVRERSGYQERLTADVSVRAADRLRVEIAVDRTGPVTIGLLASDGSWVTLLAPTLLEPGTHFSDRAASVDDHPTEGVILAGAPEAVEKARATRVFSDVAVLPITPAR